MNIQISATISVGDAGIPFPIMIDVDYEQHGNVITVKDWLEDSSPYDNPPNLWFEQVQQSIAEFFYDQNDNFKVFFTY